MATIIQLRNDTPTNWADANPVLAQGEPGWDKTNKIFKVGDGSTAWNSLAAYNPGAPAPTLVSSDATLTNPGSAAAFAFDTTGGNLAIGMFAADATGSQYALVNIGTGVVVVTLNGSDTCVGLGTITLNPYAARTVASYKTGAYSIMSYEPGASVGAAPEISVTATATLATPTRDTTYKVTPASNTTITMPAATGSGLKYSFDFDALSTYTVGFAYNGSDALESGLSLPPIVGGASFALRDLAAGVWAIE
jgi:hypothetical protein